MNYFEVYKAGRGRQLEVAFLIVRGQAESTMAELEGNDEGV